MPRAIRERPRYALLMGIGLVCLVALGVLVGALLGGGDSSRGEPGPRDVRTAQQLRATRVELRETRQDLATARAEAQAARRRTAQAQARAAGWKRRARQHEGRNRALRRALDQAQDE